MAVPAVVWKELLQDVMLAVPDPFEQTFVGVVSEMGRSRVTGSDALVTISGEPRLTTALGACLFQASLHKP